MTLHVPSSTHDFVLNIADVGIQVALPFILIVQPGRWLKLTWWHLF